MNHSRTLKTAALFALAVAVGVIAAGLLQPDLAAAAWHVVAAHSDTAGIALAFGPLVRQLEEKRAGVVKSMSDMLAAAEAADRDLSAEEKTRFDALKAENEGLKARIDRAKETELLEAGLSQGNAPAAAAQVAIGQTGVHPTDNGRAVAIGAAQVLGTRDNIEADPQRGFVNVGDFARSVHAAALSKQNGNPVDARLMRLGTQPSAAAPGTFAGEGSGADGGFLIPPGFSTELFSLSLEQDSFLAMCDDVKVNGNTMSFPRDETTPWGTDGVRAYWQGEATAGTATKPVIGMDSLRLKKLMAITPVSDEMLADSSALTSYLPSKMADSIRWKANEAILFGMGGPTPLGALVSGAAVTQVKESGQSAGTVLPQNLANMMGRLLPGSFPRSVWLVNNDVYPKLLTMTLGNFPIFMAPGSQGSPIGAAPYGMLLGRPIIVSQHASALSSLGDIILIDFRGYRTITKAEGITTATSMHLYFDADAMAFRTTFRLDGAPKASKPVTPAKGSNTLSWFVQLEAR